MFRDFFYTPHVAYLEITLTPDIYDIVSYLANGMRTSWSTFLVDQDVLGYEPELAGPLQGSQLANVDPPMRPMVASGWEGRQYDVDVEASG